MSQISISTLHQIHSWCIYLPPPAAAGRKGNKGPLHPPAPLLLLLPCGPCSWLVSPLDNVFVRADAECCAARAIRSTSQDSSFNPYPSILTWKQFSYRSKSKLVPGVNDSEGHLVEKSLVHRNGPGCIFVEVWPWVTPKVPQVLGILTISQKC